MRLRRNGSADSPREERESRAFRFELRFLNDGPPFFWGVVSVLALALSLCVLTGSVLSLRSSYYGTSEVLIGIGFLGSFVVFGTVMLGGAMGHLFPGLARLARIGDDDGPSLRRFPYLATGVAAVCFIVSAIICISSLDRMGAGAPEQDNGRYYLNNHGDRTEVSRSGYEGARAADVRMMAVVSSVFLGVSAVAASNRRNMLEDGCTDDPQDEKSSRWWWR